ncbi:class I SAM-dependent methyltransferase [Reichenbachiella ulvae]|uniref:Class I SAM-dependent methyltransferase n=1 Tax=Reichenbachiella ulvae TaxID=2980104 RepID=A0ABT3CPZ2_9BACT|nr:class I SAM-dependent methyltransferase [Reichenbachiella ulvae]MCV9385709.1 class I SAM-dependent methyltransferase [Reichenbachiella ulvae]
MSEQFIGEYIQKSSERYQKTIAFLSDKIDKEESILDLGPSNPLSDQIKSLGYDIQNTALGLDLDLDNQSVIDSKCDVLTAFEIFEHLVSPFPILKETKAKKLIASVPLRLWFSTAYWNEKDPFDRHYHEFEPRQFDMLLDKAGWKILDSQKWVDKANKIGLRPILRRFVPRHYIVYCERK